MSMYSHLHLEPFTVEELRSYYDVNLETGMLVYSGTSTTVKPASALNPRTWQKGVNNKRIQAAAALLAIATGKIPTGKVWSLGDKLRPRLADVYEAPQLGVKVTPELLKTFFSYDGRNFRVLKPLGVGTVDSIGKLAGTFDKDGYRKICIGGTQYREHQLVYLYVHGQMEPDGCGLDHVDGVKDNNSINNLRLCSKKENQRNRGIPANNTSGYKGVVYLKDRSKYRAQVCEDGKFRTLGYFTTPEEASDAYQAFAKQHHGEFHRPPA